MKKKHSNKPRTASSQMDKSDYNCNAFKKHVNNLANSSSHAEKKFSQAYGRAATLWMHAFRAQVFATPRKSWSILQSLPALHSIDRKIETSFLAQPAWQQHTHTKPCLRAAGGAPPRGWALSRLYWPWQSHMPTS